MLSYQVARRQPRSAPLPMTNGLGSFRPLKCVTDRSGPVAARPPTCTSKLSAGSRLCKVTPVWLQCYCTSAHDCLHRASVQSVRWVYTGIASPKEEPDTNAFASKAKDTKPPVARVLEVQTQELPQGPYQLSDALLGSCARCLCARLCHQR